MKVEAIVGPLQQKVEGIITQFQTKLKSALPSGSHIKYRGSLVNGIKSFKGNKLSDLAELIDPGNYDCDAFIEIPNAEWAKILDLYKNDTQRLETLRTEGKSSLSRVSKWQPAKKVLVEEQKIKQLLKKIPGYRKNANGDADFYFYVQPASKTESQEQFGNDYPKYSLSQAGLPFTEDAKGEGHKGDLTLNKTGKTYRDQNYTKLKTKYKTVF